MINLVANHQYLVGENSCGCSSRRVEYLAALLEVILVVGAIVALATTGEWGTLSNIVTIVAGFVVLVDIIRAIVMRCNIAEIKTKLATPVTITKTSYGYTINLKELFPHSKRSHLYHVYTKREAENNRSLIKKREFIFHFATDDGADLSNLRCTYQSPDQAQPSTVNDCFDGNLCPQIESGALKPYLRDNRLEADIMLNVREEMVFNLGNGNSFHVQDKANALSSQKTLKDNECILFWNLPDDKSLSNISCMTKDGIFPEWCDNRELRENIKSGAITVK